MHLVSAQGVYVLDYKLFKYLVLVELCWEVYFWVAFLKINIFGWLRDNHFMLQNHNFEIRNIISNLSTMIYINSKAVHYEDSQAESAQKLKEYYKKIQIWKLRNN